MCPFDTRFESGLGHGNGARDKVIRVLQTAWLLQEADHTVDDLARRFGVSRRTVYRDLRLLDEAGLPLVTQHAGKGYRLIVPRAGGPVLSDARAWM